MATTLTDQQKKFLRKGLMRQGRIVAKRLADVKAGLNINLSSMGLGGEDEDLKAEDKLRRYLDLIEDRRKALDDPDGDYGVCRKCGKGIPYHELDQMPWAEICRECVRGV